MGHGGRSGWAGCGDEERGDAGGHPVGGVVEPGGGPAELAVAGRAVPDHGVHGVDGAVAERARSSGESGPQQGCDHRVDGVLGDRLDDRAADLLLVQVARVAPDQRRQKSSCSVEVAGVQGGVDREGGLPQGPSGDVGGERGRAGEPTGGGADRDAGRRVGDARRPCRRVAPALEVAQGRSEGCDRMRYPRRFSEETVGGQPDASRERTAHLATTAPRRLRVQRSRPRRRRHRARRRCSRRGAHRTGGGARPSSTKDRYTSTRTSLVVITLPRYPTLYREESRGAPWKKAAARSALGEAIPQGSPLHRSSVDLTGRNKTRNPLRTHSRSRPLEYA